MATFAVIETGGKQYKVSAGTKIKVEKLEKTSGESFSFDKVLLVADGEKIELGMPYVVGAKVGAKVLSQGRHNKKIVAKFHSKTRYKKIKGHRQHFTEVEIVKV